MCASLFGPLVNTDDVSRSIQISFACVGLNCSFIRRCRTFGCPAPLHPTRRLFIRTKGLQECNAELMGTSRILVLWYSSIDISFTDEVQNSHELNPIHECVIRGGRHVETRVPRSEDMGINYGTTPTVMSELDLSRAGSSNRVLDLG